MHNSKPLLAAVAFLGVVGCASKPKAPEWTRVTPEGAGDRVVYLDTANVVVNAGLVYVTMQSRKAGVAISAAGEPFGIAHAEANCPARRIDPTALKEDQFDGSGKHLRMQLVSLTAEETTEVLARACSGR